MSLSIFKNTHIILGRQNFAYPEEESKLSSEFQKKQLRTLKMSHVFRDHYMNSDFHKRPGIIPVQSIVDWRFHDRYFFYACLNCCLEVNFQSCHFALFRSATGLVIVLNNDQTYENQSGCMLEHIAVHFKQGIVMLPLGTVKVQ